MKTAYIGLGSNLDNPALQIRQAVNHIAHTAGITVNKLSHLYHSQPLGPPQPDFVNAVAELIVQLSPSMLLRCLQRIETIQGRDRTGVYWGPRRIDLDILLFDDWVVDQPDLQIPHPGLSQREFVVYPLAEIAPNLCLPTGEKLAEIKKRCPQRGLCALAKQDESTIET